MLLDSDRYEAVINYGKDAINKLNPVKSAWTAYNKGATNINANSRGSVTPVTNEVTPLSSLHFIHDWSQIDQNQATFSIDHLSMDNLLQVLTEYQIQKLEILPPTLEELFMRHYQVQK